MAEESKEGVGTLDCVINPSVVADLGSSAPGVLRMMHVDRSDFVTAGDLIAELESGVEAAAVDLARTRADSTAEVDLRRTNAAYGDRQRDRTKDLFKRKVVSSNALDERETEARLARIQLRQARDNQSIARLELVRAEEVLKRRTISSPITGVVMELHKAVGEYVEDQPVVRVAQLDPLHVEVIVPVEHLGEVSPGMTAEVWTEVVEGQRWLAEVVRVDQVADVASGTYGVRLSLPNPDYKIPAGLRCQMALVQAAHGVTADAGTRPTETEPATSLVDDRTAAPVAVLSVSPDAAQPMSREPVVARDSTIEMIETKPVTQPSAATPVVSPGDRRKVCRVAGPFRHEIDASRYTVRLRRAGLDVEIKETEAATDVAYKVMTPVLQNPSAADEVLRSLKLAGLDDFHVDRLPAGKRRVYLGLYKQQKAAAQRAETLKKAGIKVLVRPSKSPGSSFFLVVRGLPSHDTDHLLAALPASPGGTVGELGLCERSDAVSMH